MHAPPAGELKYIQYVVCARPSDYALPCHKLVRMHHLEDPNLGGMVSLLFFMFPRKVPNRMAPLWGHSQLLPSVSERGELLGRRADMSAGERVPRHLHCGPGAEVHPGTGVGLGRKSIGEEGPAQVSRKDRDLVLHEKGFSVRQIRLDPFA